MFIAEMGAETAGAAASHARRDRLTDAAIVATFGEI